MGRTTPWSTASFFLILVMLFVAGSVASDVGGEWSSRATPLREVGPDERLLIPSPSGSAMAIIQYTTLGVSIGGRVRRPDVNVGIGTLAELGWSDDSSAFFVTQSNGGAVGTWDVTVFKLEGKRVRVIDPTKVVVRRFKSHYSCETPEVPNIGAVAWLGGARRLLLAAEVPPHSSCREMGKVLGYIVSIPSGEIIRELTAAALASESTPFLGRRLLRP